MASDGGLTDRHPDGWSGSFGRPDPVGAEPSTTLAQAARIVRASLAQAVRAAADQELVVAVQDFRLPGSGVTVRWTASKLAIGNRRLLGQLGLTISPAEARQVEQLELGKRWSTW